MQRVDSPTAAGSLPAPATTVAPGFFTNGNPGTGVPATIPNQDWFNGVQEELLAPIIAAGITPSKTVVNQLLSALQSMFGSAVGSMRNASMSVAAASASATFTADEIIVETALGGLTFRLANYSQTVNLATTGAGGMDSGAAPVSGYVALYAIYNPTTQTAGILATNATSSVAPNVYGGGNMPAGYTASALISVWPTNGSRQFNLGFQRDREISTSSVTVNLGGATGSATSVSVASAVPPNAKKLSGSMGLSNSAAATGNTLAIATSGAIGSVSMAAFIQSAGTSASVPISNLLLLLPQTVFYSATVTSGTPSCVLTISQYSI